MCAKRSYAGQGGKAGIPGPAEEVYSWRGEGHRGIDRTFSTARALYPAKAFFMTSVW